jgi:hypothetical protein
LLWPDSDAESARNSLRQRLHQLRKGVGAELIRGNATLTLAEGVSHDLHDSDTVLGHGTHDHSPEFSAWLAQQRERRNGRLRRALAELSDMAERAQDHADALVHAQELLALEPQSEGGTPTRDPPALPARRPRRRIARVRPLRAGAQGRGRGSACGRPRWRCWPHRAAAGCGGTAGAHGARRSAAPASLDRARRRTPIPRPSHRGRGACGC